MFGTSTSITIQRGDSNESEESVGDMPIELRYLESDFFMDSFVIPDAMSTDGCTNKEREDDTHISQINPLSKATLDNFSNENGGKMPLPISMAKSKSLDDLISTIIEEKSNKRKRKMAISEFKSEVDSRRPKLSETGRSSTYEEQTTSSKAEVDDFMSLQAQNYYNHQLFLLLRHRHRHVSANSQQSSRPTSTSHGSSKLTHTPGSTFDYDDLIIDEHSTSSRPLVEENEDHEDLGSRNRSSSGIMKGLKNFSASMKSIDISLRSTSISSISSGKSLFSNFSVQSDSGIGHGSGKTSTHERSRHKSTSPSSSKYRPASENVSIAGSKKTSVVEQLSTKDPIRLHSSKDTKQRTWESEPHLDKIDPGQQKLSTLLKLKRGDSADETSGTCHDIPSNSHRNPSSGTFQPAESFSGSSK